MSADQDVFNADNGVDGQGNALPWRWARIRSRTVFGNLSKLLPFNWPNKSYAASTSVYDHITGTAEQVGWRYVDSEGKVLCLKDIQIVMWELMLAKFTADEISSAIAKASTLRNWPQNFAGAPDYEK